MKDKHNEEWSNSGDSAVTEIFPLNIETNSEYKIPKEEPDDYDERVNCNTHHFEPNNGLEECETNVNASLNDEKFVLNNSPRKKIRTFSDNYNSDEFADVKSTFTVEELTSDDEIYTFGYPENFCVKGLLDNKIYHECDNDIVNTDTNEIFKLQVLDSENSFLTLALPSQKTGGSLINLPLSGKILIQEIKEMPLKCESFGNYETENEVNFPENIKVRHPLLGSDWKNHISLADRIIKNNNTSKTKSKRKMEVKKENQVLKQDVSSEKKKKKHLDT